MRTLKVVLAAALAGLVSSTGVMASPGAGTHAPEPYVVRIAFIGPLSGASEELGKSLANAAELAVMEANRLHPRIKGQRVQFRLMRLDDRGKGEGAIEAAHKAVKEGVAGVLAGVNSTTALAVLPIFTAAGAPMITPSASLPGLAETGSSSFFRMVATDGEAARTVADYLINHQNLRRVAVIDNGGIFGLDQSKTFELLSKQFGATVVWRMSGVLFNADMRPLVREAKESGAQAIFYGGYAAEGGRLAVAIQQEGGGMRLGLAQSGAVGPSFLQTARSSGEQAVTAESGLPTSLMPGWPRFHEQFQRRFNSSLYGLTPFSYDGAQALLEAVRRADSDKPSEVRDALRKLAMPGLTGFVSFDERGNRRYSTHTLYEVRQQRWVPLKVHENGRASEFARQRAPSAADDEVSSGFRIVQRREPPPAGAGKVMPD